MILGSTVACSSGTGDRGDDGAARDARALPLRVLSLPDGFELDWDPAAGVPEDPEIQVKVRTPLAEGWKDEGGWRAVPSVGAVGNSLVFDDVDVGRQYSFRIRTDDGEWATPVDRIHVVTTLPVIHLTTETSKPTFEFDQDYNDGGFALDPAGEEGTAIDAGVRIRSRGSSTWGGVPGKKSYQVEFGSKVSVLGMAPARKWVLLANYFDPSHLRNWTAMQISEATGLAWTPQARWVEVYLNGDYRGLYQVFEKVDVAKDKIALDKLDPTVTGGDAITGGYLLQITWGANPEKDGWITPHQVKIHVQRPKKKNSNAEQFDYIRDHVDAFEAALFADDFTDPDTGYRRYLDVDSFIDLWIVQELTVNTDAYVDSLYFYKKRGDDKLYFGPAWDFDTSLGTRLMFRGQTDKPWFTTSPWHSATNPGEELIGEPRWAIRLFEDPWFRARVAQRWQKALPGIEKIPAELLEASELIAPAKVNDQLRWKDTHTQGADEHRYGDLEEVDEPTHIADWLSDRIAFMTEHVESTIDEFPPD